LIVLVSVFFFVGFPPFPWCFFVLSERRERVQIFYLARKRNSVGKISEIEERTVFFCVFGFFFFFFSSLPYVGVWSGRGVVPSTQEETAQLPLQFRLRFLLPRRRVHMVFSGGLGFARDCTLFSLLGRLGGGSSGARRFLWNMRDRRLGVPPQTTRRATNPGIDAFSQFSLRFWTAGCRPEEPNSSKLCRIEFKGVFLIPL